MKNQMNAKVIVYSTPSCPWCKRAKDYFRTNGIPFKDYDVSKDRAKAEEMVKKSGQMGVPVITIGSQVIVGFDKNRIDNLLGIH
ncbi:MAG TPA: glutaredoxin family protein [Mesotoga prima]|nr:MULTISPECIES: glutaredoxin family protein [Mesotoga]HNQ69687.1 glutaredoxin family protein [Mesotoga prima]HNS75626.1 glutaredoxin family protein [Mesotoga prima]HOP37659.1 glutaredoxin family protein [Mesotoga prima]HOZ99173.1 glutaredoxin family protein [Mesotoga prima]HPE53736.1 glutaredoxin family protein [Mesotoga prima]